jgi:hypothetical protein
VSLCWYFPSLLRWYFQTLSIFIWCRRHNLEMFQARFSSVLLGEVRGFESRFLWGILVIVHRNMDRSLVWCSKADLGVLNISVSCRLQAEWFIYMRWLCLCQKLEDLPNAMNFGGSLLLREPSSGLGCLILINWALSWPEFLNASLVISVRTKLWPLFCTGEKMGNSDPLMVDTLGPMDPISDMLIDVWWFSTLTRKHAFLFLE